MKSFPSPTLIWLKEGYLAEYVSGLGPPLALHVRGRRAKAAAPFVERASRIFETKHILWALERDLSDTSGSGSLPVKLGPGGKPIRHQIEWLQPYHEGVKRVDEPRRAALKFWLGARGFPDAEILQKISLSTRLPIQQVQGMLERAGREAAAAIGETHAGPLPRGYASTQTAGGDRLAPVARPRDMEGNPRRRGVSRVARKAR